jgi:hypothetical protein
VQNPGRRTFRGTKVESPSFGILARRRWASNLESERVRANQAGKVFGGGEASRTPADLASVGSGLVSRPGRQLSGQSPYADSRPREERRGPTTAFSGCCSRGSEQLECLRFRVGVANCGPWRSVMLLAARKTNNPRQDTLTCLPPHNQATRHVRTLKRTLIALLNTALRGPS